ncbi:MAG TPA: hypothetical protein VEI73_05995 [Candidatus Acidoferrum sp.]|nr:hypothetical protein [Candidatus Acidoferrum sp.]
MKQSMGAAVATKIDLGSLKWHLLKANVAKTDLGGELPEVAIMTMSNEQFEKIRGEKKAAMEYLDAQKILKRKLIDLVFGDVTENRDGGTWIVILGHTGKSTGCVIAWQVPNKH